MRAYGTFVCLKMEVRTRRRLGGITGGAAPCKKVLEHMMCNVMAYLIV